MADVEFFFDPVCPWAWITSRWVEEVRRHRPIEVEWRFIALRMLNEHRDYDREFPEGYLDIHTLGLRLLRVAAAVRDAAGAPAVGPYYTEVGGLIHVDRRRPEMGSQEAVEAVLERLGLDPGLAAAGWDTSWDEPVRADTECALERTGRDVGTPIITWGPPDGPSFFGPVISRVPRGSEALELWDCVKQLASFPGMAELKRAIRERPIVER